MLNAFENIVLWWRTAQRRGRGSGSEKPTESSEQTTSQKETLNLIFAALTARLLNDIRAGQATAAQLNVARALLADAGITKNIASDEDSTKEIDELLEAIEKHDNASGS